MLRNCFIAIAGLLCLVGCTGSKEYRADSGMVWNTFYHITYEADEDLSSDILSALDRVEASLSPFKQNSVISLINRGDTLATDSLVERILLVSQRINRLSGGAFDPTVAPLVNLWGFGYENGSGEPTIEQLDSCKELVGIADCRIENGMMVKKAPGTQFNFSAITKGFGSDEVGRALEERGCENYMVEIGGEIALKGVNSHGGKWRIQIDAPIDDKVTSERLTVVELSDCGIATSGNYRNYRESDSGRVGHTISPSTGRPVVTEVLSATVIAPSCMEADALATACMA
ncbi:MAG: FAD:protein FMN transferase, partial [Muribaculaceae bacterium]|nr:FAD:protein FMN transferase [Muribaculaceae bacterium]